MALNDNGGAYLLSSEARRGQELNDLNSFPPKAWPIQGTRVLKSSVFKLHTK